MIYPKCLIRNLDNPNAYEPSVAIDCNIAFTRAIKGLWGDYWQIEESVYWEPRSPSVLRVIGRHTKEDGFKFIYVDDRFESYFKTLKVPVPESEAIKYLEKYISDNDLL